MQQSEEEQQKELSELQQDSQNLLEILVTEEDTDELNSAIESAEREFSTLYQIAIPSEINIVESLNEKWTKFNEAFEKLRVVLMEKDMELLNSLEAAESNLEEGPELAENIRGKEVLQEKFNAVSKAINDVKEDVKLIIDVAPQLVQEFPSRLDIAEKATLIVEKNSSMRGFLELRNAQLSEQANLMKETSRNLTALSGELKALQVSSK